jgi:hypothetical protein
MKHRKINPAGIYAGFAPAALIVATRNPAADQPEPAASMAAASGIARENPAAPSNEDTVKA